MDIILPLRESFIDYPDNSSTCLVLFTPYCSHNCLGCHTINNLGNSVITSLEVEELSSLIKERLLSINSNKLCIQGGDPLHEKTIKDIKTLISLLPEVEICIYTGYDIKHVLDNNIKVEFVKTGKLEIELKQDSIKTEEFIQFASKNQELYRKEKLVSKNGKYFFKKEGNLWKIK